MEKELPSWNALMRIDEVAIDQCHENSEGDRDQPRSPTAIANHHIMMQHRLFTYIINFKKKDFYFYFHSFRWYERCY